MKYVSPYEKLAAKAKRQSLGRERRVRTPRHPSGPEMRARLVATQYVRQINHGIIARLLTRIHHDVVRHDAPTERTRARRELRRALNPIASDMATDTTTQVREALGLSAADVEVDLSEQTYGFVDSMVSILEEYPLDATRRVQSAFEAWSSVAPEERDVGSLATLLETELDGAEGKLQNSVRFLYGDTFAQMNKTAQVQSGVVGYYWITMGDHSVREAHRAMENAEGDTPYSWDDPPLKAAQSSCEQDCHPGEDYNCRCSASPAVESNGGDDEVQTRAQGLLGTFQSIEMNGRLPSDIAIAPKPTMTPPSLRASNARVIRDPVYGKVWEVDTKSLDDVPAVAWRAGSAETVAGWYAKGDERNLDNPIKVGENLEGTRELADGNHRLAVARMVGAQRIRVRFLDLEE